MTPDDQVDYILTECFIALGQHIGDRSVSSDAVRFWRDRYRERFLATLSRQEPRAWSEDRRNVLAKAAALGRKAAELAAAEGATVISEKHALMASEENDCRPRFRSTALSIWCMPPSEADPAASTQPSAWHSCWNPLPGAVSE